MAMKIVIGTKQGKTKQQELSEEQISLITGKKIGDKVSGNDFGFDGYEFEITGGSDNSGTPMRKDVEGFTKKKILAVKGVGLKPQRHGQKQRKTVAGNTISEKTSQINIKVIKEGSQPLDAPEAPAEEKKEEAPAKEEKKEKPKKEEKPAEKKKEEPKAEEKKKE